MEGLLLEGLLFSTLVSTLPFLEGLLFTPYRSLPLVEILTPYLILRAGYTTTVNRVSLDLSKQHLRTKTFYKVG